MDWTPERVSALIALWEEGLTTSEIGRRLGVTKNAVVGKVHRIGLPKRQSPIKQSAQPAKPKMADVVVLEKLTSGMCSWPDGEPGTEEFHFCGQPAIAGKPYCAPHCERAYVKSSRDRKSTKAA
ncbi:MAG: global cell cycle regulator GcrA-like protein [Rhodospirillales bacterium]|nr:global cell cycle regulator GcrA-like protein [Rhodospirillales bacterium]